jgi:3-phosphoshikimate 1-carboxyvinyltransferase
MEPKPMIDLVPPLSKSDAQRALVLADILGVTDVIAPEEVVPRDVDVLRTGLVALRQPNADIDCHDGGAPFRFLLTQAALRPGHVTRFTGTPRLGARPHGPLLQALGDSLQCTIDISPGLWPLTVTAHANSRAVTRFEVTGAESSQFASSLLLGAARVAHQSQRACEVVVNGALTSLGYLELTQTWVERAGFRVRRTGQTWGVEPVLQRPALPPVPGDWSSLTYLLLLGWKFGASVSRVQLASGHPDERFAAHLESVGLRLVPLGHGQVIVEGSLRNGLNVDCEQCPDSVPALVALACVLPGVSSFTRIGVLRHKESDRVEGVCDFARRIGARADLEADSFRITPSTSTPAAFEFDARDDHRLAMASTVLAALTDSKLSLKGASSVSKSFPGFWSQTQKLGITVTSLE